MDSKQRISDIEKRLGEIAAEEYFLTKELDRLKGSSVASQKKYYGKRISDTRPDTKEEKISLFSALFACRTDVFPKFWENIGKGTKGYSPECKNEWVGRVCSKPKIKCSECPNRLFSVLDDDVTRAHLEGKITIGTYTIRPDDTCIFLAADFDKQSWQEDVLEYKKAAGKLSVPVYLERSRSGNGAHAWLFFLEAVPARNARALGAAILARASLNRHSISLESYDRFFPNQDFMPKGGFGNLIALPLQKQPRNSGNTVFVTDEFGPIEDQWKLLSEIYRLSADDVSELIGGLFK